MTDTVTTIQITKQADERFQSVGAFVIYHFVCIVYARTENNVTDIAINSDRPVVVEKYKKMFVKLLQGKKDGEERHTNHCNTVRLTAHIFHARANNNFE